MAKVVFALVALLLLAPIPAVLAQPDTLTIEVVEVTHEYVRNPQIDDTTFITESNLTIGAWADGSPVPFADVRLTYELKDKIERIYYKTDIWGEVTIPLPFIEFKEVEARIDVIKHGECSTVSGSMEITIVPYFWGFWH